jgi:hypothetical protein
MSHPCRRTGQLRLDLGVGLPVEPEPGAEGVPPGRGEHDGALPRGPGDPAGREERAEDLGGGRPEHVGVAAALGWLAVIALTAVSVKTVSGRRG